MPRTKSFGKRRYYFIPKQKAEEILDAKNNNASTSKKKIESAAITVSDADFDDRSIVNIIIQMNIISPLLKNIAKCKFCNQLDSLVISEDSGSRRGLCANLVLQCIYCGQATSAMSSDMTNGFDDINIRLAYGMRCIGKGNSAAKTFCAVMNLPPPPAKFERYNDILLRSLIKVSRESMKNAVEDTVKNNNRDITAAFDGSWQKRGHTSLNGVVSATCLETGKVLDFKCLSKYCFKCKNRNNKDHTCEKNFEGFSGGMESDVRASPFTQNVYAVSGRSEQSSDSPHSPLNEMVALRGEIVALSKQIERLSRDRSRNRSRTRYGKSPYRSKTPSWRENYHYNDEFCYYHNRFGSKAKKCREPCTFAKASEN
ncbi:uncharacterized protein NPIL_694341 [Nephila pilipes]|uniref:Mutator-like transposase domain-containing protein n=1 Tax=Nephila pilipes TaxID=299642 RepID=A0A8X6QLL6_NEPPI|nr:uncharacterized protein NPIL_694341 [Nephila pilipes]